MRVVKVCLLLAAVALLLVIAHNPALAQCALCKANAESSIQEGNKTAQGLNLGIMYLLLIPYALVAGIGYWWYKRNRHIGEVDPLEN